MKGHAIVLRVDGRVEEKKFDKPPTLKELQIFVDGSIELVPFFTRYSYNGITRKCIAFCNEEGKLIGLPLNLKATQLWNKRLGDVLVGDIVIVFGDEAFMREL